MSESRRMNSIARRVSLSFLLRLLFTLLLVNLFLLVNFAAWAAYGFEKAALGTAWQMDLQRSVTADSAKTGLAWLQSIQYGFALPGGSASLVDIGPMLVTASRVLWGLMLAEAVLVLIIYRGFHKRTLYLLQPLKQMAVTAESLSRLKPDEQVYHSLEDAIENLSVQSPGARLSTGHSELSGLEDAVNNLISRMHASYNQQTRFVSDASHELRTPIAVVRGYADLLSRWGKDDPKIMEEAVSAIRQEADSMQRLVEQLLFLARGDAGRIPFQSGKVDLAAMIQEAQEECRLLNSPNPWRVLADGPVYARGDEDMLKQALRILVDNAIKFSPEGGVLTLRAYMSPQGLACLSVQDNGEGIKQEDLPHIFERFYRSDPARGRGGTGLGLSIAKWIAHRHEGHIDVFSREGLGTRFTLNLPAWDGETREGKTETAP